MTLLWWLILGFLAGWIASIIMKTDSTQGFLADILLGITGAIVGGLIMNLFGAQGVDGFNVWSLVVATFGAIVLIWAGRQLSHYR